MGLASLQDRAAFLLQFSLHGKGNLKWSASWSQSSMHVDSQVAKHCQNMLNRPPLLC